MEEQVLKEQGATGPAFLTVADVSGNTGPYSGITTLKFDDTTGLDIAPTAANEVTVSIGSHWYSILVDGQTTLTPSGAQNIEFIAGTGMLSPILRYLTFNGMQQGVEEQVQRASRSNWTNRIKEQREIRNS